MQFLLIAAVLYAVITNEGGEYSNTFQPSLMLFYVKLPCSVALHFFLFPRAQTGMNIMKFANNNPGLFVDSGAVAVSYTLGLIQFLTALAVEYVNVNILAYQTSIENSIIYFVMLHNLSEVAEIYFHAQHHKNPIAKCMEIHPTRKSKGRDLQFSQRSFCSKVGRVFYRAIRSIYVSVIFYLFPWIILLFVWHQNASHEGEGHEEGGGEH